MREKPIEIMIVGTRCVYLNNYRIAGSKPYVSENLPHWIFRTSIEDVLAAFSLDEIRATLKAHHPSAGNGEENE